MLSDTQLYEDGTGSEHSSVAPRKSSISRSYSQFDEAQPTADPGKLSSSHDGSLSIALGTSLPVAPPRKPKRRSTGPELEAHSLQNGQAVLRNSGSGSSLNDHRMHFRNVSSRRISDDSTLGSLDEELSGDLGGLIQYCGEADMGILRKSESGAHLYLNDVNIMPPSSIQRSLHKEHRKSAPPQLASSQQLDQSVPCFRMRGDIHKTGGLDVQSIPNVPIPENQVLSLNVSPPTVVLSTAVPQDNVPVFSISSPQSDSKSLADSGVFDQVVPKLDDDAAPPRPPEPHHYVPYGVQGKQDHNVQLNVDHRLEKTVSEQCARQSQGARPVQMRAKSLKSAGSVDRHHGSVIEEGETRGSSTVLNKGMTASGEDKFPTNISFRTSLYSLDEDALLHAGEDILSKPQTYTSQSAAFHRTNGASCRRSDSYSGAAPALVNHMHQRTIEKSASDMGLNEQFELLGDVRATTKSRPNNPPSYEEAIYRQSQLQDSPREFNLTERDIVIQQKNSAKAKKLYEESLQRYQTRDRKPSGAWSQANDEYSTSEKSTPPAYKQACQQTSQVHQQKSPGQHVHSSSNVNHQSRKAPYGKMLQEELWQSPSASAKTSSVRRTDSPEQERHSRIDSPARRTNSSGSKNRHRKTDSPARKTDSPARKTDSPARKTDAPARKIDSPGRNTDSHGRKTDSHRRKTDSPERKTDSPGRKTDSHSRKTDSPARKVDSSPRKVDSSPRKVVDSSPRKVDSSPRKVDSSPRKVDSSPRKVDSSPRKIDSPARTAESPGRPRNSPAGAIDSPVRTNSPASHNDYASSYARRQSDTPQVPHQRSDIIKQSVYPVRRQHSHRQSTDNHSHRQSTDNHGQRPSPRDQYTQTEYAERQTDLQARHTERPADLQARHTERPADLQARHTERPADLQARHTERPADLQARHTERPADLQARHTERPADLQTRHQPTRQADSNQENVSGQSSVKSLSRNSSHGSREGTPRRSHEASQNDQIPRVGSDRSRHQQHRERRRSGSRSRERRTGQRYSDPKMSTAKAALITNLSRSKSDSQEYFDRVNRVNTLMTYENNKENMSLEDIRVEKRRSNRSTPERNPSDERLKLHRDDRNRRKSVPTNILKAAADQLLQSEKDHRDSAALVRQLSIPSVRNKDWHKELASQYSDKFHQPKQAVVAPSSKVIKFGYVSQSNNQSQHDGEKSKRRWTPPVHPTKDLVYVTKDEKHASRSRSGSSRRSSGQDNKGKSLELATSRSDDLHNVQGENRKSKSETKIQSKNNSNTENSMKQPGMHMKPSGMHMKPSGTHNDECILTEDQQDASLNWSVTQLCNQFTDDKLHKQKINQKTRTGKNTNQAFYSPGSEPPAAVSRHRSPRSTAPWHSKNQRTHAISVHEHTNPNADEAYV